MGDSHGIGWRFTAVIAAAVAGCVINDDVGGGRQAAGILLHEMPEEIAKSVCPRAYQCCTPIQLMDNKQAGTDEASCEAETTASFRNMAGSIASSEKKGRLVYQGEKLAACLAHIRSASCQELNRTNHLSGVDCEPWIDPKVAAGGACATDGECIDGFCQKEPMAFEGRCQVHAGIGESCAEPARCRKGLACHGDAKTCYQPQPEGAPCQGAGECASGRCVAADPRGGKVCGPSAGEYCFYSSACAVGPDGPPSPSYVLAVSLFVLALRLRRRADR